MKLKNCLLGNKSFLREGYTVGKNHTKCLTASEASARAIIIFAKMTYFLGCPKLKII